MEKGTGPETGNPLTERLVTRTPGEDLVTEVGGRPVTGVSGDPVTGASERKAGDPVTGTKQVSGDPVTGASERKAGIP